MTPFFSIAFRASFAGFNWLWFFTARLSLEIMFFLSGWYQKIAILDLLFSYKYKCDILFFFIFAIADKQAINFYLSLRVR